MRHETDVLSLVFGLLFVGGAAVAALIELEVVDWSVIPILLPVGLVAIGLTGIGAALFRERRE